MSRLSVHGRRGRALAVLAAGALFAHAALLEALDAVWPGQRGEAAQAAVLQVRSVRVLPQAEPAPVAPVAPPVPAETVVRAEPAPAAVGTAGPPPGPRAAARAARPLPALPADTVPPRAEAGLLNVAAASTADESAAAASPGSTAAPAAAGEAETAPLYRTQFAPALTLHYELRRGLLQGSGTMAWRPAGDRYELRLDGRVAGLAVLTQLSQGGFDAAGLAPVRFTDQRLRGAVRAANFQRAAGKITFSGPSDEYPLVPGVQDRLSWMIQLAAVLEAEPRHAADGGRVTLPVVGARADLGLWTFRFDGAVRLATPAGELTAWHFSREPRGVHDTHVEVWLDPARHHLPVRATMRNAGEDDALELLLRSIEPAP